jgi:superfamily II DNA/RNA helicase
MTADALHEWLLSDGIKEQLALVTRATAALELGTLQPAEELSDQLDALDWERLLLAGSMLARSNKRPPIEAALRIATAAVNLQTPSKIRDAGGVLLQKLSNYRAVDLAIKRGLVRPDLDSRLGVAARVEAFTRRLENSVLVEHTGDWLRVNRFQQNFWNEARRPQTWISASAPTASGKTFLVSRWLLDEIQTTSSRVAVYLAPTRALVGEIEQSLNLIIRQESVSSVEVTSLPLSAKYTDAIAKKANVIFVLTQERLHLLANGLNDDLKIDILIADEAHKVGDRLRGVVLQDALERVERSSPAIKIVFLSPATQNPETLLDDAPSTVSTEAIDSDSPTVLQNIVLATQQPGRTKEWNLSLRSTSGELTSIGTLFLQARPTSIKKKLALLAASAGMGGGTLIYSNGAAEAEEIAFLLSQLIDAPEIKPDAELVALADLAKKGVHESYLLASVARKGVAFHYGNMPSLLREEIERLFRSGKIRFLVCTSTLIEGVNLSCRTIIVRGPRKGVGQPMEPHDFWNLAGRAGRWGNEFQGNIICVDPKDPIAWPDGVPQRQRYAIERETDGIIRGDQELQEFIATRWHRATNEVSTDSQLEQVCAYLLATYLRDGSILSAPFTKRHDGELIVALNASLCELAKNITIAPELAGRHSAVNPVGLQRLMNHFRAHTGDIKELLPTTPESDDAYVRMSKIMESINDHIYPAFQPTTLIPLHALIVLEWLKGYSLAAIIKARIAYHTRHRRALQLPKLIRNTMELIEQTARFRAPKYISAYMDVLRSYLIEIDRQDLISEEMDVALALEFGVSTRTLISLIELGLSRMTAVAVNERIALDDLDRDEARKWIEEHNGQFEGMDIPAIIISEIRRKILGIDSVGPATTPSGQ